ncbi:transcriptional repressor LexA [Salinispira pacifica]|uniref:LexA repressor n=1 Tax=Salinispira pacifica TaxID=1307761 RepID=V5WLZ5_9SPIO|nr:transcriptional repressor LexA [Salinispira pacifica]AHC16630.1 SOS-response repressor and protease LexA [Salinispira pacifica]
MKGLTARQTEVLNFIKSFIREHKFPPTVREVSENFHMSVRGAYDHIKALEKKHVLRCNNMRSRAIEVLDHPEQQYASAAVAGNEKEEGLQHRIPILGSVAAGKPIHAEENWDGHVSVPSDFLRNGRHFALQIRGDSMTGAGIMEGDLAIVKEQSTAENGEIIVAMLEDSVTLKRFYREANRVKLQSENSKYPPMYTRDIRILGKLEHIIRTY